MPRLDVATLLLTLVITNVVLALSLVVATGRARGRGVGKWSASLVLQALSFLAFALRGPIPEMVSIAIVNASAALSLSMQCDAIFEFHDRPFPRWIHLAGPVVVSALFATLHASSRARFTLSGVVYGTAGFALAAFVRAVSRKSPRRGGHNGVALSLALGATVMSARGVVAIVRPEAFASAGHGGLVPTASTLFAQMLTMVSSLAFLLMQRERQEHEIEVLAMTDPLTGVLNRRTLFSLGEDVIARARKNGSPVSVVILDIDHFKRINDAHGHQAGDAVLREFVRVVRSALRESDLLTRYGGEEFCLVLPDASTESARAVAERVRTAIAENPFRVDGTLLNVTSSAGVASAGERETGLSALLRRADEALYSAKRDGRNRVVLADVALDAA